MILTNENEIITTDIGDILLNVGIATVAAVVVGIAIYYSPASVASFIDRISYKITAPFKAILRPILRLMRIIDSE